MHLATSSAFYRDYTALTEWCARLSGQYGPSNGQYGHDDGQYGPDNRILHSNSLPLEYAHVVTPLSTGGNISQTCDKYKIYSDCEIVNNITLYSIVFAPTKMTESYSIAKYMNFSDMCEVDDFARYANDDMLMTIC